MKASPIRCLVSAGPTREYFDPVRFLSNPSTGKMGYALAAAAAEAGWVVDLVSGPVALPAPPGVAVEHVETGQQMFEAIDRRFDQCDVLIMTAAIMDYRPKEKADHKIKKFELSMVIEMEPVVDVLKTVAARKREGQLVVGFAAETNQLEDYAMRKLTEKNCDFIAANRIGAGGVGFASDENTLLLLGHDGFRQQFGPEKKVLIARQLIQFLEQCR
jgi:phosphopantothenoylcysteine synthetase/decarboxylase